MTETSFRSEPARVIIDDYAPLPRAPSPTQPMHHSFHAYHDDQVSSSDMGRSYPPPGVQQQPYYQRYVDTTPLATEVWRIERELTRRLDRIASQMQKKSKHSGREEIAIFKVENDEFRSRVSQVEQDCTVIAKRVGASENILQLTDQIVNLQRKEINDLADNFHSSMEEVNKFREQLDAQTNAVTELQQHLLNMLNESRSAVSTLGEATKEALTTEADRTAAMISELRRVTEEALSKLASQVNESLLSQQESITKIIKTIDEKHEKLHTEMVQRITDMETKTKKREKSVEDIQKGHDETRNGLEQLSKELETERSAREALEKELKVMKEKETGHRDQTDRKLQALAGDLGDFKARLIGFLNQQMLGALGGGIGQSQANLAGSMPMFGSMGNLSQYNNTFPLGRSHTNLQNHSQHPDPETASQQSSGGDLASRRTHESSNVLRHSLANLGLSRETIGGDDDIREFLANLNLK
eukprot:Clim_evm45s210 gene=Clim_evmTU45s210